LRHLEPQSRVRAGADSVAIKATGGRVAIPGLGIQETQALGRAIDPGAPRKADQGVGNSWRAALTVARRDRRCLIVPVLVGFKLPIV